MKGLIRDALSDALNPSKLNAKQLPFTWFFTNSQTEAFTKDEESWMQNPSNSPKNTFA